MTFTIASLSRRTFLAATSFAFAEAVAARGLLSQDLAERLAELEHGAGGRLGVAMLDCGSGRLIGRRLDERFPMCSTFKVLAAGLVLHRVATGEERLDRRVVFGAADLVTYSPITSTHVGEPGMTIEMLCHAAITASDNTAGNLLLASFGGPAALTRYARSLGDPMTRLDRIETELNEALPGDPRDTTTPAAMARTVRKLLFGAALPPEGRALLARWLVDSQTGATRLRAGLPAGWAVGDKTGAGGMGTTNDVAAIWPMGRAPIIVAAYMTGGTLAAEPRNAILASVGRLVAAGY